MKEPLDESAVRAYRAYSLMMILAALLAGALGMIGTVTFGRVETATLTVIAIYVVLAHWKAFRAVDEELVRRARSHSTAQVAVASVVALGCGVAALVTRHPELLIGSLAAAIAGYFHWRVLDRVRRPV